MERWTPLLVYPWTGGVRTDVDPSLIGINQLVQADNIIMDTRGSRKKRAPINKDWDSGTSGSDDIILKHEFWDDSTGSKVQRIVTLDEAKAFAQYQSDGTRAAITDGGTAYASAVTTGTACTLNNLMIIAVDGASNVTKMWAGVGGNIADLTGSPPNASLCRVHLGRVWLNEKSNRDRLHYSTTANPTEWNGTGDSGAIDIGVGDGDPEGITAIFPTFKGVLFVAKRTKLYKISGFSPETFEVELVSSGIGCVSQNSIAQIDNDDMFFLSERGVHSLEATAAFADFEATFVSADIQKTINENWTRSRFKYFWGAYLAEINSYAIAVTDESIGTGSNNCLWLYNIPLKAWYRWGTPAQALSCQTLITVTDSDKKRFYLGSSTGRVYKTQSSGSNDTSEAGATSNIIVVVKTGRIFPDNNPDSIKKFNIFGLIFKPEGTHNFTAVVKIDNFPDQSFTFSSTSGADLLGSTFILGQSVLGFDIPLEPASFQLDGYGRGFTLTIMQQDSGDPVEVQGFLVKYEGAESQQESGLSDLNTGQ